MSVFIIVLLGFYIFYMVTGRAGAAVGEPYIYYPHTRYPGKDHRYEFAIKQVSGGYRCYIQRKPSLRGRPGGGHTIHVLTESFSGRQYICWTGRITNRRQAQQLCRNWATAVQKYIDTGTSGF